MTSRNLILALSKYNKNKYEECWSYLLKVINLFQYLKIGKKSHYKSTYTGVIISTNSILHLMEYLLNKRYKFVLTSRFSQDCLESVFSIKKCYIYVQKMLYQLQFNLKII